MRSEHLGIAILVALWAAGCAGNTDPTSGDDLGRPVAHGHAVAWPTPRYGVASR
jgi:hypothetical protein